MSCCCSNPDDSSKKEEGACSCGCGSTPKPLSGRVILFVAALTALAFASLLRDGLQSFRTGDRFVTVRGLATREVDADLAVWAIRHAATSNVLETARAQLEKDSAATKAFLVEGGIAPDAISVLSIDSQDLLAQQYRPDNVENGRYVLTETLLVRTSDVEAVSKLSQNINGLLARGVVLSNTAVPTYVFTKLNDVKPEMIADATKNARAGAEQFAKDSGQSVGNIRNATQGYFEIQARDPVMDVPENAQRKKVVRVVTSIDFYLE